VSRWPVGLRDARLLALRRRLFGPALAVVASCPSCGERVESAFRVDDVLVPQEPSRQAPDEPRTIDRHGYVVAYRLPTSGDLVALAETPTDGGPGPRQRLLSRCVTGIRAADGSAVALASVPEAIVAAVVGAMAAADPQADVQLGCRCPSCLGTWSTIFDITTVLWSEIHAWARRLLRDVHTLARAYGWREQDVLALSPTRRRIYLEMVGP